jgi:soluble lytic murein transglycosylase
MVINKLFPRICCLIILTALILPAAEAKKQKHGFASDDDAFLALRDAARSNDADKATAIAARLADYPIPSYVAYYQLKARIADASADEVLGFIARYKGSAIADRLRNDWLLELGKRGDWTTFDQQYPLFELGDDTQLKCYALTSQALKGVNVADQTRALLNAPKKYGDACIDLIGTLVQAKQFDRDAAWRQVRLAAETGSSDYVQKFAPIVEVEEGDLDKAMTKPALIVTHSPGLRYAKHELFVLALGRLARSDPQQAADTLSETLLLSSEQRKQAWAQIALQASRQLVPQAVEYWEKAGDKLALSTEGYQWRVRAALRAENWTLVKTWIDAMPAALRDDASWIYWYGRALKASGAPLDAEKLFQSIAAQTNFYGQLALEELGGKVVIPPRAKPVTAEELAPMRNNAGFRRALKFFDLDLRFEGYREWNWELRGMNDRQLLAAAEYARQQKVLDRMVNTSDRTRTKFDFSQRFPAPHREQMQQATQQLGLEMAWVYGLIRQESRFVSSARSHVGASGLMQLMPGTARYVAKKIGLSNFKASQVNDVETNLALGTGYLNMIMEDLDQSQPLATAGYNAGPRRSVAWRATLSKPLEGAIFAETIPFSETRDYVKKVMSNATYYAAMFEAQPQSLKARLGIITPAADTPIDLP